MDILMEQHNRDVVDVGFFLVIQYNWSFPGWTSGGIGTNSKAEMLALWALLRFAYSKGIKSLVIRGDSKFIIDSASKNVTIHYIYLQQWGNGVREAKNDFDSISYQHIFRELNVEADSLSKKALKLQPERLFLEEFKEARSISSFSIQYF